jgi:DNA-binding NtrC family response regulator
VEREYLMSVLEQAGGDRAQAARQLGSGTATLYRKLKISMESRGPRRPELAI